MSYTSVLVLVYKRRTAHVSVRFFYVTAFPSRAILVHMTIYL
jgi:hypothetical protein